MTDKFPWNGLTKDKVKSIKKFLIDRTSLKDEQKFCTHVLENFHYNINLVRDQAIKRLSWKVSMT